jgi:hypothetical protein
MANPQQLYTLQPLTKEDLADYTPLAIPEDELQLQVDCINVLEKRVPIESFSSDYQQKIKDYYRFSGTKMYSDKSIFFKRTLDTLDLV